MTSATILDHLRRTALACALGATLMAADAAWTTDFEAAKGQAAQDGKDLLVDFTGSDWCGWCIKLKEEVFDHQAFAAAAPRDFVLVELDFPREKPQSDALKAANRALNQRYEVSGYPTILLLDAAGRAYARTGYRKGGPEAYVQHLAELKQAKAKRDAALAAATAASGADQARQLDAVLESLLANRVPLAGYEAEIARIVAGDADGALGLKAKYALRPQLAAIKAALQGGDLAGAGSRIDEALNADGVPAATRQELLAYKGAIAYRSGQKAEAVEFLRQAVAADPANERAAELKTVLGRVEAEVGK